MFDVVLFEPEIPANAGNVVRLCANTGARLHLIHPLGFVWDDKRLRRAGLDYHEFSSVTHHDNWADFCAQHQGPRFALTTKGTEPPSQVVLPADAALVFGPETRGLPAPVLDDIGAKRWLRLPMVVGSRSLNLANAVAATVYEAWRQHDYRGAA